MEEQEKIQGRIPYLMTITTTSVKEKGGKIRKTYDYAYTLNGDNTIEDDMVSLAAAKRALEEIVAGLSLAKPVNASEKRQMANVIKKGKEAVFGLQIVLGYYQNLYPVHKKNMAKAAENKDKGIKKLVEDLNKNGVPKPSADVPLSIVKDDEQTNEN